MRCASWDTSSGSSSCRSSASRFRARSSTPTRRGSRRAAAAVVAAVQLSLLADSVAFFTALGGDELGRRAKWSSRSAGSTVHAAFVDAPQRRGVHLRRRDGRADDHDDRGAARPRGHDDTLPWHELARLRRRLLLRRRRRRAPARASRRACWSRPRGCWRRSARGGRARRARREREGRVGALPRRATSTRSRTSSSRPPARSAAGRSRAGRSRRRRGHRRSLDAYGAGDCFAAGLAFALG